MMQSSDLQGARARFQEAIQQNPSDGPSYGYLGVVLIRLGDSAGGLAALQQAVRLQPGNTGALYNLAVALAQLQRTDDARAALQHALSMEPENAKLKSALDRLGSTAVVVQPAAAPAPPAYAPPPTTMGGMGGMGGLGGPVPLTGEPLAGPPIQPAYGQPQQSYGTPPSPYGMPAPGHGAAGPSYGSSRPGMTYVPPGPSRSAQLTAGQRIGRGIGWGILFGQAWTLYFGIRLLIFGAMVAGATGGEGAGMIGLGIGIVLVIFAIGHAFLGMICGFLIGAMDATDDVGAVIGIVASIIAMASQYFVGVRSTIGLVIGVFYAISIGKVIGAGIANKVQGA